MGPAPISRLVPSVGCAEFPSHSVGLSGGAWVTLNFIQGKERLRGNSDKTSAGQLVYKLGQVGRAVNSHTPSFSGEEPERSRDGPRPLMEGKPFLHCSQSL